MEAPLILQEWIDKAVMDRTKNQERLIALAIAMGAKTITIEWDELFSRKILWNINALSRRKRRKALRLAIENLEKGLQ
jgi:hypothetical protein